MTNPTRQIGEAVAWRCRIDADSDWYPLAAEYVEKRIADCLEVQPLIPASDLSTITRQLDEAVRLLREVNEYGPGRYCVRECELHDEIEAFLATVEDKP